MSPDVAAGFGLCVGVFLIGYWISTVLRLITGRIEE